MSISKTIRIDPVTRIEGHGRVVIQIDNGGQVSDAFLQTVEFRGFEKFCEGRMLWDMPLIISRICGFCPVSHHLASVKACEHLLGVEIPQPATMLRELLHMGQIIQSHALHFFFLGMPDFMGKELAPEERNVFGLIDKSKSLASNAIKLRRVGQDIIDRVGGGRLHPVACIPGGMSRALPYGDRMALFEAVAHGVRLGQMAVSLAKDIRSKNAEHFEGFASFPSSYMGLVKGEQLELYDGNIRVVGSDGALLEEFAPKEYTAYVEERVDARSYMKGVYLKKGGGNGFYRVAPLARINVAKSISTQLANAELQELKALGGGKPLSASLYYHYARMIELLYALERARELLRDPEIMSPHVRVRVERRGGEGVGVVEAPRGTLIHHYWANEQGRITKVNLVVSTAHNKEAMNQAVKSVARSIVKNGTVQEADLAHIETAIRCYDPCLSCSTHAWGRMPLDVILETQDGRQLGKWHRGDST
jgi:NAD-reducing hydrogenase large subunit